MAKKSCQAQALGHIYPYSAAVISPDKTVERKTRQEKTRARRVQVTS